MGWELWLLGLEQYVGSGADTTDDLQRWRLTDEGKDYLKRATHAWGRAEITHGEFGISQPAVSQHLEVLRERPKCEGSWSELATLASTCWPAHGCGPPLFRTRSFF